MQYWEVIADKLHAAGWWWGYCSAVTPLAGAGSLTPIAKVAATLSILTNAERIFWNWNRRYCDRARCFGISRTKIIPRFQQISWTPADVGAHPSG
jgi:hypothetical protein